MYQGESRTDIYQRNDLSPKNVSFHILEYTRRFSRFLIAGKQVYNFLCLSVSLVGKLEQSILRVSGKI